MSTQLATSGHQPELSGRRSLSDRVSRTVLVGLPITTLALCLGVTADANPIIKFAADRLTLAAMSLDDGAIAKCAGGAGGGGGMEAATVAARRRQVVVRVAGGGGQAVVEAPEVVELEAGRRWRCGAGGGGAGAGGAGAGGAGGGAGGGGAGGGGAGAGGASAEVPVLAPAVLGGAGAGAGGGGAGGGGCWWRRWWRQCWRWRGGWRASGGGDGGRAAAEMEPLRPAGAVAQRVPVSVEAAVETAPLVAARRVRSVHRTLPVLPARALPQAVAPPAGRRRMGRPRGQPVRRQALGAGRGATSWRPLPVRKCAAPTSCVPCTSGAMPSRAQPIA